MGLTVCWLPDDVADAVVRRLWDRLEQAGVPTLRSHTHGRHVPHLTLASLTFADADAVFAALSELAQGPTVQVRFDALGVFRRSRCWLAPAVSEQMLARQAAVVAAALATGAALHPHYRTGAWLPHLTLAPRLRLRDLATVAERTNEVLPLAARLPAAALVHTSTGEVRPLPHLL